MSAEAWDYAVPTRPSERADAVAAWTRAGDAGDVRAVNTLAGLRDPALKDVLQRWATVDDVRAVGALRGLLFLGAPVQAELEAVGHRFGRVGAALAADALAARARATGDLEPLFAQLGHPDGLTRVKAKNQLEAALDVPAEWLDAPQTPYRVMGIRLGTRLGTVYEEASARLSAVFRGLQRGADPTTLLPSFVPSDSDALEHFLANSGPFSAWDVSSASKWSPHERDWVEAYALSCLPPPGPRWAAQAIGDLGWRHLVPALREALTQVDVDDRARQDAMTAALDALV